MNDLLHLIGFETWKPVIAALLLPPVPWLLLMLVGARTILWRRGLGWFLVLLSVAGIWLCSTTGVGQWMMRAVLPMAPALNADRIAQLKTDMARNGGLVVVVLGGGRESMAPEYGVSNLTAPSLERLRYGLWLSRETGAPVGFSGGTGHGQVSGTPEAEVAQRIASREFGKPLNWIEDESRDTRENATHTVGVLQNQKDKPRTIVLVTHAWHMARATRAFEQAAERAGLRVQVLPAPIGLAARGEKPALRWLPSSEGFTLVRRVLAERIGLWAGA